MKSAVDKSHRLLRETLPAMRRAAGRAWRLAVETGTPFYVYQDGKVVNLNPKGRLRRRRTV